MKAQTVRWIAPLGALAVASALFLLLPPAQAHASGPLPIGYFCPPETSSYTEDGAYQPTNGFCTYLSASLPLGGRYGDLYVGSVGSSTLASGHSLGNATTSVQNDGIVLSLATGTEVFVAIYQVRTGPAFNDLAQFRSYFQTGSGAPPHDSYGTLRWVVGEETPSCTENCFSNILFLPGFMGSRLSLNGEQVWPPVLFDGTENSILALDPNGEPTTPNIVPFEALSGLPTIDIYDSFFTDLDSLKGQGTINNWEAFPYDWRLWVNDPRTLAPLVEALAALASTSKSGKVTIISHSNGGLLAKALAQYLGDTEAAAFIDKMILVGSPQIGTPKSVGAMLHGYEQGIPSFFPILISPEESRSLGKNMPGAYGLLPSSAYFGTVFEPIIKFEGTGTEFFYQATDAYGLAVTTHQELTSFLVGAEGREDAAEYDLVNPSVLNALLLGETTALHADLDVWVPPVSIGVYQIAGWGEETVKGFTYRGGHYCGLGLCKEILRTIPEFTMDGDGTVVAPSALFMSTSSPNVHRYWLDLLDFNGDRPDFLRAKHSNILSAQPTQDLIKNLIQDVLDPIPDQYVLEDSPSFHSKERRLRFLLHSPLALSATDPLGNEISLATSTIPGARFEQFGEAQYLSLPASSAPTIHLNALSDGNFTLDIEEVEGDTIIATTTFLLIPNTEQTKATIDFANGSIATAGPLQIDKNGNGTIDLEIPTELNGTATFVPAPLIVTADSQSIILGVAIPPLTYSISGFIGDDSETSNDVTGSAACTTTATNDSPAGVYPIVCTVGTLSSMDYSFDSFVPGLLTIAYRFDGFLQPINDTTYHPEQAPSVFKGGSTIPVKFQLKNVNGEQVEAGTPPSWLTPEKLYPMAANVDEAAYTLPSTNGDTYRFDQNTKQYIYNWGTKGFEKGYWYSVFVQLNGDIMYAVRVGLK